MNLYGENEKEEQTLRAGTHAASFFLCAFGPFVFPLFSYLDLIYVVKFYFAFILYSTLIVDKIY